MGAPQNSKDSILHVIAQYAIGQKDFSYRPYGSGHINDSYLLTCQAGGKRQAAEQYLLQRINHEVFRDVEALMYNMNRVTTYLKQKLSGEQNFTTVEVIPDTNGKSFCRDLRGNFWRLLTFIPHSISYDVVTAPQQAFEAGFAFGKFQVLLDGIPAAELQETIPGFHDMAYRFRNFEQALTKNPLGRKNEVAEEIQFALDRKQVMLRLNASVQQGEVPVRITHNDTKLNNVLLHELTQHALCVIDLDTVMPGVVWYDFGDAVRSIASTAAEDEAAREQIAVNMEYYRAFAQGYLQEAGSMLSQKEVDQLAFSCQYMTFIMGLRFLTDYLEGDRYYKIKHARHNLQRARAQFALLSDMESRFKEMAAIVKEFYHPPPSKKT